MSFNVITETCLKLTLNVQEKSVLRHTFILNNVHVSTWHIISNIYIRDYKDSKLE